MKLRKMLYGLTLLLGVLALNSCVNEDSACLPEDSNAKVAFSLVLPDNAQTRAEGDWSDTYNPEIGTDYDNFIDLNGIQFLVFENTENGAYVGTIDDFMYTKTGPNVYTYYGTAPEDLEATGTYKFVVLANCSSVTLTDQSTIADLDEDITYSLANMKYIPMWGVHTEKLALTPGETYPFKEDIFLLRAVAKVTVKLSEGTDDSMISKGFTLKSLTVDKYNTDGFVLPAGASSVAKTTVLDQETCINAKSSLAQQGLEFSGDKRTDKSVVFYLPEYKNTLATATSGEGSDASGDESTTQTIEHATMSVVLEQNGEELSFPAGIEFKDYNDTGNEYDIVRNHHYIFTITGAEVGHKLTLVVQTVPWEDESVTVDYTETIEWKQDAGPRWATPTTTVITTEGDFSVLNVNGGDDLSCSFTLDAPEGWLWYAELEPLTTGASNFITFNDGTTFASGSVGQAATLYVKIATGSADVTHRSRLRLYVRTPSGDKSLEVRNLYYIISRSI